MEPDKGFSSTVRVDNLHAMEMLHKLSARCGRPSCSGQIDRERAERGQKLFDRTCALCHETYGKSGSLNEYQLFALDVVGTDPGAAINFERTVMTAEGPKPFGIAAFEIVKKVKAAYYAEHNIPADVQAQWESKATRESGVPCAAARVPEVPGHPAARRLSREDAEGNLGDGAVPPQRLGPHHLRSAPSGERAPDDVQAGTKEYDPVKLGVVDGPRFPTPPRMQPFTYDTRPLGNWNTGHEWWFYPDLDDEMRYDIIEFLKTFDPGTIAGAAGLPAGDGADAESLAERARTRSIRGSVTRHEHDHAAAE